MGTGYRLARVDRAEAAVRALLTEAGIPITDLRVRDLGGAARVEVPAGDLPVVQAALAAARIPELAELAEPTLAPGETWRDVKDATADIDALGARGMAYEALDQLALEHLYGVR